MSKASITDQAKELDWSDRNYIILHEPRSGPRGDYVALIRTQAGQFGRFHATCTSVPVGVSGFDLLWEYRVRFDDGDTGTQMCKNRPSFEALLEEIVPLVK